MPFYDIQTLGQDQAQAVPVEPGAIVETDFSILGKVWTDLFSQCEKYLRPDQCRYILGYRPVVVPVDNTNPGGIKWYWFLLGGLILGRVSKR